MKNYTFQEWQRFFGIKKNFPADLGTEVSTTPKELEKKKAIKGEKNPGNALAKESDLTLIHITRCRHALKCRSP